MIKCRAHKATLFCCIGKASRPVCKSHAQEPENTYPVHPAELTPWLLVNKGA
jgi:hypothetical protein